jgi:trehalose synthase
MDEALIPQLPASEFADLLQPPVYAAFDQAMARATKALHRHTMWHLNTTLTGGGVAEMLGAMLPYVCDAGIDCRWVMVDGDDDFLQVTKRLHNALHGEPGSFGAKDRKVYQDTLAQSAARLDFQVRRGDVVFVHDPQTAGLIPALKARGAIVVWHCHIGTDRPNDSARAAWRFLHDFVAQADRYIFTRPGYLWERLSPGKLRVIQPSINPFSTKNRALSDDEVHARVDAIVPAQSPVLLQAARWDKLKDHLGVLELFAEYLAHARPDLHLILAGPSVDEVSDDPEGASVLAECQAYQANLPPSVRDRTHLLSTSMADLDEANLTVNALQRRAQVVLVKSLAEGFGLVVSEAMWKQRPVVASRVGGIQDQVQHRTSGLLVDDPSDGAGFARAVGDLLDDPARAGEIGKNAHARVAEHFLTSRQLTETMRLVSALAG